MTIAIAAVLGLLISACGGGSGSRAAHGVHLDGRATGNYVIETSASGTAFLLPASYVALQGSHAFDVVNAANGLVTSGRSAASLYRMGVAQATGVVPRNARVELLATGSPGLRFLLQWTDTCGESGGSGQLTLRSPAVVNLRLPRSNSATTCYVAASAATRTFTSLRLAILDH